MSRQRFIQLVREYARLADRKHETFGEQVQTVFDIRVKSILRDYPDEQERKKELDWTEAAIKREYAGFDRDFTLKPSAFDWTRPMG